jgi:coiled-coil-helix-coiled-coil-helix domain-containing protein 2
MAATAGSVAVGSTIGHGLSSMLFGGRGNEPEAQAPPQTQQTQAQGISCEVQAKGV